MKTTKDKTMNPVTEDYPRLSVHVLKGEGYVSEGQPVYSFTHDSRSYSVDLEWLPSEIGGTRLYLRCPGCNQRKIILSAIPELLCQACSGLPNRSRQRSKYQRAADQLRKLQRQCGCEYWENISKPKLVRPQGMHIGTFATLTSKAIKAVAVLQSSSSPAYEQQASLVIEARY